MVDLQLINMNMAEDTYPDKYSAGDAEISIGPCMPGTTSITLNSNLYKSLLYSLGHRLHLSIKAQSVI